MTRTMYVLQNEDGFFYWKNESTSSSHGLKEGFENAFLFKTRQGAERRRKLPFLSKADLRDAYPYGLLAKPLDECVRIHSTSGTTGRRVIAFYTQHDVDL